ncbi:MAG TPA: phospholipase D-like domain-containing protein [Vicinamibacteria bacterium]|jgi:cardiolipin synthase
MIELIPSELVLLGSVLVVAAAAVATVHAALYKDEVRTAIGWVAVIVLVPFLGALLYYLIGINRIRRRAVALRRENERTMLPLPPGWLRPAQVGEILGGSADAAAVANLVGKITGLPLLGGNRIRPLQNGDEAFPAMLEAIASASKSVSLQTYIFDNDRWGRQFVDALCAARDRGVEVRVLIDAVGSRYSRPPVTRLLRAQGIRTALFLPARFSTLFFPSFNLRNHRKVLVVDGRIGFTGGMNIREDFVLADRPRRPGMDLHFQVEGPVVRDLQETFAEDWEFTTSESLWGQDWFPRLSPVGTSIARGIADGPDDDLDVLTFTLLGALASARRSIRIVTPYFLPDPPLVYALGAAALGGLHVDIVIPEAGNLRLVTWAMWGQIRQVLQHECRVWLAPSSPFDHSKIAVMDDYWTLLGSTNWDPRSLKLNFEFNVECYDRDLARRMNQLVDSKIAGSRRLTTEEMEKRSLPLRLRDGAARLLTPYL